jgi:hypothetical protein
MKTIETHIENLEEPYRSIMLYIRAVILRTLPDCEERLRYGIPFFHYDRKPLCYFNRLKNTDYVDVAFVQGILLEKDFPFLKDGKNRKQVRSIPVVTIEALNEKEFIKLLIEAAKLLKKSKKAWFLN